MKKHHGDERLFAAMQSNECRAKVRHPSKRHALSAGRATLIDDRMSRKARRKGIVLSAYHCRICKAWHLGNSPRRYVTDDAAIVRADRPTLLEQQLAFVLRIVIAEATV